MQALPDWARRILGDDGYARIEAAIEAAESTTAGEIVPMVVRRSSTIGHVPFATFCVLLLSGLLVDLPHLLGRAGGPYGIWLVAVWVVAGIGAFVAARFDAVQRALTPRADQIQQVEMRAEVEFFEQGVGRTKGDTGILLFVSLMEHRAVVLADRSIAERVAPDIWQELVDTMIRGVRRGDFAAGMSEAIARCGEILAPHFPIQPADQNELRDHLIVKD